MPTREEIREGRWQILRKYGFHVFQADKALDEIEQFDHSQGVGIKVACPKCDGDGRADKHFVRQFSNRCPKCNGYGFKEVESLVEEG